MAVDEKSQIRALESLVSPRSAPTSNAAGGVPNGQTLAPATTGCTEGQVTPAGRSIRTWLNCLGALTGNG